MDEKFREVDFGSFRKTINESEVHQIKETASHCGNTWEGSSISYMIILLGKDVGRKLQ